MGLVVTPVPSRTRVVLQVRAGGVGCRRRCTEEDVDGERAHLRVRRVPLEQPPQSFVLPQRVQNVGGQVRVVLGALAPRASGTGPPGCA